MKMKKTLSAALLSTVIGLSASMVSAYDLPMRGPIPFATWDANGNGTIEEQEFNTVREQRQEMMKSSGFMGRNMAGAPTFTQLDRDSDSMVTEEELTAMQQEGRWANRGIGRGHHGAGYNKQGNMMPRYQAMDDADKEKYDAFFATTTDLRNEIMIKRAEKQALMRSTNPDPDQAAQLTRDLIELRGQMMAQAEEAGVEMGQGRAHGYGHGGRGHGGARW